MKRKLISIIVPIVLILIVGAIAVGSIIIDKYSYSKENADLVEYFQISDGQVAIILQDERIDEKAIIRNDICYFDLETVHKYIDDIFYVDQIENVLLYTNAIGTYSVAFEGTTMNSELIGQDASPEELPYIAVFAEGETVYIAADYIKKLVNYSVDRYETHVQVYTQWDSKQVATVKKDTNIRVKGGIKSPILCKLAKGDSVQVLEKMENWSAVKSENSLIGYVENKFLEEEITVTETPVTDVVIPEYTSVRMEGKVNLGFHAIGGYAGNDTLDSMVAESKGMNVIAPTWFSLSDNEGNYRSFGDSNYVKKAHDMGLQVWGVLDDFNYRNENNAEVDIYSILSSTTKRKNLVQSITQKALELGMDGINLDFEKVSDEAGIHFVQFIRELSVLCRQNNLVLSSDNFVPFHFNNHYRLDIQGQVLDYVIIMGYDEHWHGSGEPGSVASIGYVQDGIAKTVEQVPAEKVVNALPLYTILWKSEGATVTDEYLTVKNTADFINRLGITLAWDEETCQNYAEWEDGDIFYQIWFEDVQSIAAKLNVMEAQNIGGVAVWRLGYGINPIWELLNTYTNK